MKRKDVDAAKAEIQRLLARIEKMEYLAGWHRYDSNGNQANSTAHPDDIFNSGEFVAAVKRSSLDVQKAMTQMRNS